MHTAFVEGTDVVFPKCGAKFCHQLVGRCFDAIDILFVYQFVVHKVKMLFQPLELPNDFRPDLALSQSLVER